MVSPIVVELVQYDQNGTKIATGETGVVVSEHLLPVPDPSSASGLRFQAMLGICWENNRVPAVSYHSPEEVEWLSIPAIENDEDEDEDEDEVEAEGEDQIAFVQTEDTY